MLTLSNRTIPYDEGTESYLFSARDIFQPRYSTPAYEKGIQGATRSYPDFVTLGEEVRAWKFLLHKYFDAMRHKGDELAREWF